MLIVGTNKSDIIRDLPETFLIIDDGELIDQLPRQKKRGTHLDLSRHHLNPLQNVTYRKATELASLLYAASPQGQNTLTVRNGARALRRLFLSSDKLNRIQFDSSDAEQEAKGLLDDLFLSPTLKPFLTRTTNFSLNGILIARLDRSILTDFEAFVIGNLLISNYQGHVIVPDFGFYGCPFHKTLIREGRLSAGVNFLDESPLKDSLLLMDNKVASGCTAKDAEVLAVYEGYIPNTNEYHDYIHAALS